MNKNQKMLFMAGFPRAGSTLLANILSENPKLYSTPTSGLITSVIHIKRNWRENEIYNASGEEYIYPKIRTMIKNMMIGHYEEQILNGQLPIDKNRMWISAIDLLDEIFKCKVKIIYPIRHIGECINSMEKVNRKSELNFHGNEFIEDQTTLGRAEKFIQDDGIFGQCILHLRELMYRNELNRLVFVPYTDLLLYPNETLNRIYDELELKRFNHDFKNIKQKIFEQDMHHGFAPKSLHTIMEGELRKPKLKDYTMFDIDYIKNIEYERYKDITELINKYSIVKELKDDE